MSFAFKNSINSFLVTSSSYNREHVSIRRRMLIFVFKLHICAYVCICFSDMENNHAINYAFHLNAEQEQF